MIYQFTGQPGHGKTLSALDFAIDFKNKGRIVYVCNVRDFDHEKAGMQPMTADDFRNWMTFLPDGAVCLVDEVYEKAMLPKRPPSAALPMHVERLATHRHRGIDFIFVCQSPDKQMDTFVHDLIDQHTHVRRLFGTTFINQRVFDRFEAKAERATPITVNRIRLPKRPMGLYKSTEFDTTERRIPWYYKAFIIGLPAVIIFGYYVMNRLEDRFMGENPDTSQKQASTVTAANGAQATVAAVNVEKPPTGRNYAELLTPRIDGQPWSAPAYDSSPMRDTPPRIFCVSSGYDGSDSCSCITDQGTKYFVKMETCRVIARNGQLDPFYDPDMGERSRMSSVRAENELRRDSIENYRRLNEGSPKSNLAFGEMATYGDHGLAPPGTNSIGSN